MTSLLRAALALPITLMAANAWAHDPPQGTGIFWAPGGAGDPASTSSSSPASAGASTSERMIIATNRGLLVSNPGATVFQLLCNEGMSDGLGPPVPIAVAPDGAVSMATFGSGLITASPDLCQWSSVPGPLGAAPAFDIVLVPGQPATRYALSSTGSSTTGLFVSHDGGGSFSLIGGGQVPYTRVRLAPSAPNRLYRSAVDVGPDTSLVHRLSVSDDGGATQVERTIPLGAQDLQARLLAVDPLDADRVYLHVESTSNELPDRLIVTSDAGRSFATLATMPAMNGFALSDDGQTVWVGGADGLWRSTDRGAHFAPMADAGLSRITCLDHHQGRLFACAVSDDAFNITVSTDEGETFHRFLAFSQVETGVSCPADSTVGSQCRAPTIHFRQEVSPPPAGGSSTPATPGTATGGATGASALPSSAAPKAGSGCSYLPTPAASRTRSLVSGGSAFGLNSSDVAPALVSFASLWLILRLGDLRIRQSRRRQRPKLKSLPRS